MLSLTRKAAFGSFESDMRCFAEIDPEGFSECLCPGDLEPYRRVSAHGYCLVQVLFVFSDTHDRVLSVIQ